MRRIIRTVFTVEILAPEKIDHVTSADDPTGLDYLKFLLLEGRCLGQVEWKSSEVVDPNKLVKKLISLGDDGTFFGDQDDD